MIKTAAIVLSLFILTAPIFAAKKSKLPTRLPNLPKGATIYLENVSPRSSEAKRFQSTLQSTMSRTDHKHKHEWVRPGLNPVDTKDAADYVLRFSVVAGERERGCNALSCSYTYTQGHFRATVLLLKSNGAELWSQEYYCSEPVGGISAEMCAHQLANDLKSAQVDDYGEPTESKGWRKERTSADRQ